MAKGLLLLLALVAFLPAVAGADSISPSSYSGSGPTGSIYTVNKTVTVTKDTSGGTVDVYFLADTTGSMYYTIAAVQASASAILAGTAGYGDVQFGVGEYKDFGDVYTYRLNQAMTSSAAAAQAGINLWDADGGGDYQEAELYALNRVATDAATGWRDGSTRILVWFGDASGHDPSGGVTEAMATAALVGQHIKVAAIDVGTMNDTGQPGRIAAATGGAYYAGIDSSSIVDTIKGAIDAAIKNYSSVCLGTAGLDPTKVAVTWTPDCYIGAFDRSLDRTFGFTVTFEDLEVGTHTFAVTALVDGAIVAREADSITSTAIPEPGTLLLLGSGLVGFVARRRRAA